MQKHNMFYGEIQTHAFMLIYHQMLSLSASLDQIQKIGKIGSILFIYLFINLKLKKRFWAQNTHFKLSKNFC